jgi:hypothetical protein
METIVKTVYPRGATRKALGKTTRRHSSRRAQGASAMSFSAWIGTVTRAPSGT